jgi:hypothetical protein
MVIVADAVGRWTLWILPKGKANKEDGQRLAEMMCEKTGG